MATDGTDFIDADCRHLCTDCMLGFRVHVLVIFANPAPFMVAASSPAFASYGAASRGEIIVPLLIKEAKKHFPPSGGAIFLRMGASG